MVKTGAKKRPAKPRVSKQTKATSAAGDGFRIDVDMDEAERAAVRVRGWLVALRERHQGLARYEFTRHVRIVPASATFSHPILTLGTRFAESEDHLLATYLHEQMYCHSSTNWCAGIQRRRRGCRMARATTSRPTCISSSAGWNCTRWQSSLAGIARRPWQRPTMATAGFIGRSCVTVRRWARCSPKMVFCPCQLLPTCSGRVHG
jgi:hypothetical protein